MKKKTILYSFFIIFVALFIFPQLSNAAPTRTTTEEAFTVTILNAYYIEDDIYSTIEIWTQTQSASENYYLKLTLVNPIEIETTYLVKVMTHSEHLILNVVFYNSATVAGDYTILATIISNNRWIAETDVIIFDPPSGGSEGDPYIGITIG